MHDLIVGAREHFNKVRTSVYDEDEELHLKPMKQLLVDVVASRSAIDKALALANELLLTLEDRGHRAVVAPHALRLSGPLIDVREEGGHENGRPVVWRPLRPTVVFIGETPIGLTIYELTENIELRRVNGKYVKLDVPIPKLPKWQTTWTVQKDVPTGRLAILAYCPQRGVEWQQRWTERRAGSLKSQCAKIGRELEKSVAEIARRVEQAEREEEEWRKKREIEHREWERKEAERQRLLAEKESQEQLLEIIEQWAFACRIESFFTDVAKAADRLEENDRSNVLSRLDRARSHFGGPEALSWFREWQIAEERVR